MNGFRPLWMKAKGGSLPDSLVAHITHWPADLEVGDTAGWEACATSVFTFTCLDLELRRAIGVR